MPTIEDVEKVWNRLKKCEDEAEQPIFASLAFIHLKMDPLYNDLHKNWDESHAEIFIRAMENLCKVFLNIDVTSDA